MVANTMSNSFVSIMQALVTSDEYICFCSESFVIMGLSKRAMSMLRVCGPELVCRVVLPLASFVDVVVGCCNQTDCAAVDAGDLLLTEFIDRSTLLELMSNQGRHAGFNGSNRFNRQTVR